MTKTAKPGRRRPTRLTFVLGVIIAAAIATGVTVGSLTFGGFLSSPHQTGAAGGPTPPTGISFPLAEATLVSATSTPPTGSCTSSNLGTLATPTLLTDGVNTSLCLSNSVGGYALGDAMYILQVSWAPAAVASHEFEVQVFMSVTPSANDIYATSYVNTSATITSYEGAVYAVDLTQSADTALVGFNILVTQL